MSDEDYHLGYFEAIRNVVHKFIISCETYEADGVVEMQLNSELFFNWLESELKDAKENNSL